MRSLTIALLTSLSVTLPQIGAAVAETSGAGGALAQATHAAYSTQTTDLGTLLDDPAAKAIVDKYLPGLSTNDQVDSARNMTLTEMQQYAPDTITAPALAKIDADLAKLPKK
ncbi:MAG TPA: hypothetical protein VKZ79_20460 [Alphaproteobacteria bacterium]|nr:hypothetical protein [Alphaproteobacteria bacterium]